MSARVYVASKKTYLTEPEMARFLRAARSGRYKVRDYLLMLMAYRHGMRVSELIDVRMDEIDLEGASLRVRRSKGSLTTQQPIEGDELRAIRAWLRERSTMRCAIGSPFLFLGERGPLTRQADRLVMSIGLVEHAKEVLWRNDYDLLSEYNLRTLLIASRQRQKSGRCAM